MLISELPIGPQHSNISHYIDKLSCALVCLPLAYPSAICLSLIAHLAFSLLRFFYSTKWLLFHLINPHSLKVELIETFLHQTNGKESTVNRALGGSTYPS